MIRMIGFKIQKDSVLCIGLVLSVSWTCENILYAECGLYVIVTDTCQTLAVFFILSKAGTVRRMFPEYQRKAPMYEAFLFRKQSFFLPLFIFQWLIVAFSGPNVDHSGRTFWVWEGPLHNRKSWTLEQCFNTHLPNIEEQPDLHNQHRKQLLSVAEAVFSYDTVQRCVCVCVCVWERERAHVLVWPAHLVCLGSKSNLRWTYLPTADPWSHRLSQTESLYCMN